LKYTVNFYLLCLNQGRIQDFKLGGAEFKKLRRVEGGAKIFGVFRVKKHDFTPKNHIFSNFRWGARWIRPCKLCSFQHGNCKKEAELVEEGNVDVGQR
jgi:hypothetical protein